MIRSGICSRADLAEQTGLTQASITYITKDLIECGLIYETGIIEGRTGHPSIGLSIRREKFNVIGIQINRNYVQAGVFSIDGTPILHQEIHFTEAQVPDIMMHSVFSCLDDLLAQKSEDSVWVG